MTNKTKPLDETEKKIEVHLKEDPKNFSPVLKELHELQKKDHDHFKEDLVKINQKLRSSGLLPHMQIIQDGNNLSVVADSSNPKGEAVVSTSEHIPHESKRESRIYKHMHFDGWKSSLTGGGGADGHYKSDAVFGEVPTGKRLEMIELALKLAGLRPTQENIKAVNEIVMHESGWNPNAINLDDKNAAAGHPSKGLMQTIGDTFQKYALPGFNTNITDPLSNLIAGIRYATARYGSLERVPGIMKLASGEKYVGY